jgi:hypothetical protein
MLFIILVMIYFGTFVYIFSISKEHNLVFSFMSIVCMSVIRCIVLRTLYMYGNCAYSCNISVNCFATLYAGEFIQLIIGLIGVMFM